MPKIAWSKLAHADLSAIVEYISEDNPDAAQSLINDIVGKVEKLPSFPQMGRTGRVANTRELVALANYIVVYQCTPELIRILRILHAARQWPPLDE
ncbi:type II toxin-antitoxin system RelE/ParE family toxin [Bowmanella denitrificans]|uniref:Type II toxin-antitoxin system RelE/ParE family toxin n=1 Tax=Bowmanella denitrificans TaxID=366582 RepID=A0ABN0WS86_9ALTE|nr:type II toxin-antitoxin system RelE/ParE family toxin [Bowmanella denitrificans]